MPPVIDIRKCKGCGKCDLNCPGDVIHMRSDGRKPEVRYPRECWHCGACRMDCPTGAISFRFPLEMI